MKDSVNAIIITSAILAAYAVGRVHGLELALAIVRGARAARSAPRVEHGR